MKQLMIVAAVLTLGCTTWHWSTKCGWGLEPTLNYGPEHQPAPCGDGEIEHKGFCWMPMSVKPPCKGDTSSMPDNA